MAALPALANVGFGALVFGQAVTQQPLSLPMIIVGLLQWVILVGAAWIIAGVEQ